MRGRIEQPWGGSQFLSDDDAGAVAQAGKPAPQAFGAPFKIRLARQRGPNPVRILDNALDKLHFHFCASSSAALNQCFMTHNLFNSLQKFDLGNGKQGLFYSLPALEKAGLSRVSRLPVSLRLVLGSVLRHC